MPAWFSSASAILSSMPQQSPFLRALSILLSNFMLLFREKVSPDWLSKVLANLPAVLVDHAHLERKAATSALNLEKYRDLFPRVEELNAIAIEELQHFQLVLDLLKQRGIPFGPPYPSTCIAGLMMFIRDGQGNHDAAYLLMARAIDEIETSRRLDFYLELDARLIREPNPLPMLH